MFRWIVNMTIRFPTMHIIGKIRIRKNENKEISMKTVFQARNSEGHS